MTIMFIAFLMIAALFLVAYVLHKQSPKIRLANIGEGTHTALTKKATAALATRHLLVTLGASVDYMKVCAADDIPYGTCPDEPTAADDLAAVFLLGVQPETMKMVGSEAIAVGAEVYTAGAGKVSDLSAVAGTYYKVGRALTACGGDGQEVEVQPCYPVATVVS